MLRNQAWRRFEILDRHFLHTKPTLNPPPVIVAHPRTSLINEKVRIQLQGLVPNQTVRLLAKLEENNVKFESTAVYRANAAGDIDLEYDASLGGSYTGKHYNNYLHFLIR